MTPDEARSLGRALRAVRLEHGLSQLKVAVTAGISAGQIGIWERGQVPAARGRSAHAPALTRQLKRPGFDGDIDYPGRDHQSYGRTSQVPE